MKLFDNKSGNIVVVVVILVVTIFIMGIISYVEYVEIHKLTRELKSMSLRIKEINMSLNGKKTEELYSKGIANKLSSKQCEYISRQEFINLIDNSKSILEIGPFANPSIKGDNVKYFDVVDREGLINNNAKNGFGLDITKIPKIDYVEPKGGLSIVKDKFDIVFSSHNIEHQVDLIKHLQQVSNILKENGKFFLFIPDKRYTFDHFSWETPFSEVLAVHEGKQDVHSLSTVLSRCEDAHNDCPRHWSGDHGYISAQEIPRHWGGVHGDIDAQELDCYKNIIKKFNDANGGYIDSHKWRVTPTSFEHIMRSLYEMGYISFQIEKIFCTAVDSNEFSVILSKNNKIN